jgi:hypothetical protein
MPAIYGNYPLDRGNFLGNITSWIGEIFSGILPFGSGKFGLRYHHLPRQDLNIQTLGERVKKEE